MSFLIHFRRGGSRMAGTMNLAPPSSTVAFVFELTVGHISEQQFVQINHRVSPLFFFNCTDMPSAKKSSIFFEHC